MNMYGTNNTTYDNVYGDNNGNMNFYASGYGGGIIIPSTSSNGITSPVGGITLLTIGNFAYASLPATGHVGRWAFCTNCLKPSEAAGSGTGMMVFDDGHSEWVSTAGTIAAH